MSTALEALLISLSIPFEKDVPMRTHTTLRVGGPASLWVTPRTADELRMVLDAARDAGEAVTIIGGGSNLLVRDGGIRGVTVSLGQAMAAISIEEDRIHAQAGARIGQVALAAQAAGLAGMEGISGIPGTIGGGLCMNAGCYGAEIADFVETVEAVDPQGGVHTLSREEMDFAYRHSVLSARGWIATGATLRLTPGDPDEIARHMKDFAAQRRAKQPLTLPSAGSFFKRPEGHFAGALIEAAGLKGLTVGGAQVSEMHAGFLVNIGGATAKDFLDLMGEIQARVLAHSGVQLEAEVQILGCDSYC